MQRTWPSIVVVALAAFAALGARLAAQPVSPAEAVDANRPDESAPRASADAPLRTRQNQIRQRFAELEKLLLRMAELTAPTDPRRAALLRRAVAQSKQRDVDHQFEELVKLLGQRRLARALSGQDDVQRDLAGLLDLLLSEDRGKRIESEKERIRQYLKRVNKIIKEQKSLRGQTARGGDTQPLAQRQGELSEKTGKLAKDMESNDAEKQLPDESDAERDASEDDAPNGNDSPDTGDSDKSDRDQGDKEGSKSDKSEQGEKGDNPQDRGESEKEDQPSDQPGEPSEGDAGQQPSKDKPGRSQDQPPMPGQPSQGQGESSDSPPSDNNPAQRRLEQAEQRMREAQEKLEQAKREEAAEKEAEALAELERAKAELEEILRQLREEEMARMLAMLEGRFRKMLDAQVEVYEGSKRVDRVPEAQRDRDDEIEAGRLSRKEAQIVVAADKCLILLREEGSAVAFPEAVVEMREDMQQVVERLARAEVGTLTQAIETDIIAALEEMISALKKAQRDMEDKQQQPNQGQVAGGEPPLVDALAELRMIRALQMRVNKRTQRYAALSEKDQADTPELLEALRRLAEREERIHRVTRDIVVRRNR